MERQVADDPGGRVLVESAQQIARHMRGEIRLPMKVVRVAPDVDVRAIREGQGLTREQFAERYGLQVRAIQEWEQGRRKPESAVRAYMLVIENQPGAVRKALAAAEKPVGKWPQLGMPTKTLRPSSR